MTQTLWEIEHVAKKVAFIECIHTCNKPCSYCLSKVEQELESLNLDLIVVIARFLEPETKKIDKITPLTWCAAVTLSFEILKVIK